MKPVIEAIVFDLGGVLVDWNPEYLYRKIFTTPEQMRTFLSDICTLEWNEQQDEGRSLREGTDSLVSEHPDFENEIRAYYGRWEEMLGGPISGTVAILKRLKDSRIPLYALTNWSQETYPIALERYEFLHWFDGVVVSGREGDRKPFASFYRLLMTRYSLTASTTLFIDDNARNVAGALEAGMQAVQFRSPGQLEAVLDTYTLVTGSPK